MTRDLSATRPVRPTPEGHRALDLPRLTAATAEAVGADGAFGYQLLRFDGRVHFSAVHADGGRRFCDATNDRPEAAVVAGGVRYRLERLERLDAGTPLVIAIPTAGRPVVLGARALLTEGQQRVAELAALGATTDEIARHLGRSPHTIHHHIKAIYARLGIGSRVELAQQILG